MTLRNPRRWLAAGTAAAAAVLVVGGVLKLRGTASMRPVSSPAPSVTTPGVVGAKADWLPLRSARSATTTGKGTTPAGWTAKFRASDDYLKFVKEALPPAVNSDGRAAWYVGEVLRKCSLVMRLYRGSADPEAQLNQELASMSKAPQWARDLRAQETRRCLGLALEDAFKDLPPREGGYPISYWEQQALAGNDPLAQERAAAEALAAVAVTPNMSRDERANQFRIAQTDLRGAMMSGDPDALYQAGMLLADPHYSTDSLSGVAVALAACDLGRDCSAANPDNVFYRCRLSGACPADADLAYYLQQSLGAEGYAQVYARAQEVKQLIQAGDWNAVMASLKLKGS